MLKDIFCLRQQHCGVEEEKEGMGEGGERESNASKQVPAPSAPTYRNPFLWPHVIGKDIIYAITHDGRSGHDIKNLFMALRGPLICTLHQSSVHVNQSFLLQYLSRVTVRFPPCMFTYILNRSVILAWKYGAVVLCVAEQLSPERPHARLWDAKKWNTGKLKKKSMQYEEGKLTLFQSSSGYSPKDCWVIFNLHW